MENLKDYLDSLVLKYNTPDFINDDPVQFPHRFTERHDIEIVAFLAATIAWGKRTMIINSSNKMLNIMGNSPYDYVMSGGFESLDPSMNIHRTFFCRDLVYFCKGFQYMYSKSDSLEEVFTLNGNTDTWRGIQNFRESMEAANGNVKSRQISDPCCDVRKTGSACKRLHLALRWLVRDDGIVDLGIWKNIRPSQLMIPLDVHVANTSRRLGLTERKQNDLVTVEEITAKLRSFDPEDPVKYDFALFGVEMGN